MWCVFAFIWSPVPQQTRRGYSTVVLDHSQALPSSPSLFCTWILGGGWERGYVSLVRLPQQLHKQHALLSLMSWAYSACALFALLFQQRRALSHLILHFSLRFLRCLCGSLREHDYALLTTPEASLQELQYQLPLRFTLGTGCIVRYFQIFTMRLLLFNKIYGTTYKYICTYIQTPLAFKMLMWGLLRLAPITSVFVARLTKSGSGPQRKHFSLIFTFWPGY